MLAKRTRVRNQRLTTPASHVCAGASIAPGSDMPRRFTNFRLTIFVCIVGVCCPPAQSAASEDGAAAASRIAANVINLTNAERYQHRRRALQANARLMRAAQLQAVQMARAAHMDHVLPDARYPRAADRLAAVEYRWRAYGENVAFGQANADKVVDSWMHSRGHRANILNSTFTEMGVGYAVDRTRRPYYLQVFATPLS